MPIRDYGVRLGLATGTRWDWNELDEFWGAAEQMGFDSLWMTDHILTESYDTSSGAPEPTEPDQLPPAVPMLEAWTFLAALARATTRATVGTLVSPVTFRHPALLAKQALSVDRMTNGRLILGLGAGYTEREHRTFGLPYPPARERVAMLSETLDILHLLETEEYASYEGSHYRLENAPCQPKPVDGHIPLLLGATRPAMLRLAARHADHYNAVGSPNYVRDRYADLDRACAEVGRDPSEISRSVGLFFAPVDPLSSIERALHVIERFRAVGAGEIIFGVRPEHRAVIEELAAHLDA